MEISGPAVGRAALVWLRHVATGPARRRPAPRSRLLRYAAPFGVFAAISLGLATFAYLAENRSLSEPFAALIATGSVLPVAVAVRRPLVGWRLAYPMLFLGAFGHRAGEPWNPTQIAGYLAVLVLVAITEDSAVTYWIATLTMVPAVLFLPDEAIALVMPLAAVALLGELMTRRRQSRAQLAEQAELTAVEQERRAVLEERARIAREMHDVVAHHMSMIAVRAETAPFRVGDLSGPARAELAGIASSARSALADMRRLLGVLRADTEAAAREPQPGMAELPELVAAARRAGVPVTWSMDGDGAVPEPVALSAYRIVQEALANAARHAPGGAVDAAVRALPDRLEISVRNAPPRTGPAAAPAGAGHGLTGMRERAELLGGTLTAGPDAGGGYAVTATLPYGGEPS